MNKATELNIGSHIKLNNQIWKVIEKSHVKPGKGVAYIQTKLKNIDGTKLEHRFSSNDSIEQVMIQQKHYVFSYFEKDNAILLDINTYESLEISPEMLPQFSAYLLKKFACDNLEITIEFADEKILDIKLPNPIKVTIDLAEPVVKGQTAASSYKTAIIKEDITIGVPLYVNSGDEILINLYAEKGIEFVQRA